MEETLIEDTLKIILKAEGDQDWIRKELQLLCIRVRVLEGRERHEATMKNIESVFQTKLKL